MLLAADTNHKLMAVEVTCGDFKLVVVGVYLPYYSSNNDYGNDIMISVGFIESVINQYVTNSNYKFLLIGNFNFQCQKLANCER